MANNRLLENALNYFTQSSRKRIQRIREIRLKPRILPTFSGDQINRKIN